MFTHFRISGNFAAICRIHKTSALFLAIVLYAGLAVAQPYPVKITIAVTPPYTAKISDYTSQPNKIMATLQNTSVTTGQLQIYLVGIISSESGIKVSTEPGYRPSQPFILNQGITMLNLNNIGEIFNEDHLVYEGITKQEIIYGNGLPEDDYTICLQAYDYNTGVRLSDEEPLGCSPPFTITDLEPPVILQPICQEEITPIFPQSMLISWTMPAGAPPNVQYRLMMIEVLPADHNINDAISSATHPVFFESIVFGNAFVFGPAQPALVVGKTYAFNVTAIDPAGRDSFRNGGTSETCSFNYGSSVVALDTTNAGGFIPTGDFEHEFELVPNTVISGRLLCKYPDSPETLIQIIENNNNNITLPGNQTIYAPGGGNNTYTYNEIAGFGSIIQGNANNTSTGYGFGNYFLGGITAGNEAPPELNEYGEPLIQQMLTKKYIFGNTEDQKYTKPLPHTIVKLVARVATFGLFSHFGTDYPLEYGVSDPMYKALNLKGRMENAGAYANVVLDVTETDENGNYTFDFSSPFFTGPVIATELKTGGVEETQTPNPLEELGWGVFPGLEGGLVNFGQGQGLSAFNIPGMGQVVPGGGYHPSGNEQQAMSLQITSQDSKGYLCLKVEVENQKFCSPDIDIFAMPGDVLNLPVQVAKLKTYNLTVNVKSNNQQNQLNNANAPLAGVAVSIFRGDDDVEKELPLIIAYEGQRLSTKTYNNNGVFKNVSLGKTKVDGTIKFKNLVKHAYINPQYLIDVSTRDFDKVETSYDNTLYNYKNIFSALETTAGSNAITNNHYIPNYNHEFPAPTEEVKEFIMEPLPPEIKGRVMALTNIQNTGLKDVQVELLNQAGYTKYADITAFINGCYGHRERQINTNDAGFFRFPGLWVNDNNPDKNVLGPYRRLWIKYPAYNAVIIPPFNELPYNLSYGQLKDIKDVNLVPEKMIAGYVQDEEGKPVACYVKSAYSPYYKTVKKVMSYSVNFADTYRETFSVPTVYDQVKLTVSPLSSQYFSRDTSFIIHSGDAKITVFKKLHRPVITVKNSHGIVIAEAVVKIGNYEATTDTKGIVRFKFAAPADQFVIKIIPPEGYAPLQEPISIPVSQAWTNYTFVLKPSKSIQGIITESLSKLPVENALVFAELLQTDGMPLYIEATSNAQGLYLLKGIPEDLKQMTVHVVKEGTNPSWIGTSKLIVLPGSNLGNNIPTHNFSITRLSDWDMSKIWGFPIVVESFKAVRVPAGQPEEANISGYILKPPVVKGFALLQQELRIPFVNVKVRKSGNNKPEPVASAVPLEILEIPVNVASTYTGMLRGFKTMAHGDKKPVKTVLVLDHRALFNDGAGIEGQVKLELNSFELSNNFTGELYIGDDTLSSTAVVFTGTFLPNLGGSHYVFSISSGMKPVPVKNYKVFNFNADADLGQSVQDGSTIKLRTILHTNIPGCATCQPIDLKIRAGDLVINGPEISFVEAANEKLNFNLEKWKVISQKSWFFDKNEESIVLPEVLIVTSQGVDARVKNMKIRPTTFNEGAIDLTGGLTLGGIAPLKLSGTLKPIFNYDNSIGHYRISLVGQSNEAAGYVDNLPNTSPDRLEFQSIGMLSNSENVLTIGKKFRFYNIMDMWVDQIMTGDGFFKLNGQPELGIPEYIPQSAVVAYTKENNKLKATVEPLKGVVECTGNVNFKLDPAPLSQSVTTGKFTTYGDVKIMPGDGMSGPPFYLRGYLTKTNNKCSFDIIQVDNAGKYTGSIPQVMTVGTSKILVLSGKEEVSGNSWGLLSYKGKTAAINGLNPPGKPDNILDFLVNGAIDVSNSDLKVTNIDTPLGGLSMVYNFSDGSMVGTLTMKNVPLGYAYLTNGLAAIRFDNNGFYIAINLNSFIIGPLGEFKGGFIVGSTKKVQPEDIAGILKFRTALPPFTTTGLTGLFVLGEKVIVDESINLVFATVTAQSGLGLVVTTNFNSNPEVSIGGYGYVYMSGSEGFDFQLLSCEVGACLTAYFSVKGGYYNSTFNIENCASLAFKPYIDGSCEDVLKALGLGSILDIVDDGISLKNEFGCNGSNFYFHLTPFATCPGSNNGSTNSDCN